MDNTLPQVSKVNTRELREENYQADALACAATLLPIYQTVILLVSYQTNPSNLIDSQGNQIENLISCWMEPIEEYSLNNKLLDDDQKAYWVQIVSTRHTMI